MILPEYAHLAMWLIVAVSIVLMLVRPRNIPEFYWICGGVLLLLGFRLISLQLTWLALAKAVDVCLFLIGMMLISELAREHGVFDWLSSMAMRRAGGSCVKLFAMVYAVGTIVTVFLSNDATAVVLTPAILTAVRKARVKPLPYLFVCAFIANAASFVLPISNPANLVVFRNGMPPLASWMAAFALPSAVSIAVTFFLLRWIFRVQLAHTIEEPVEEYTLGANGRLVVGSVAFMVAVLLTASAVGVDLGLPTCLVAVLITAAICLKERSHPLPLLREISWGTLALVAGLFVMVDAVENIGAMHYTQQWLAWAQGLGFLAGKFITGFVVGVANNLVNNLPLGLIAASTLHITHASSTVADAVLIGVDLGPNLSITGSLATILWLIALRKEQLDVSFWDFLKIGAIVMPVALATALASAILLQFCFGLA
jgi:arsenical pump membrane protein